MFFSLFFITILLLKVTDWPLGDQNQKPPGSDYDRDTKFEAY